jgi:plasmid maintenance system killer protein
MSKWRYPKQVAEKLIATENFIQQAVSLQDIFQYPPFRFHSLRGDRKDEWSISIGKTGYRITVIPCDLSGEEIIVGDILGQSKSIKVISITEVSNHYE